MILEDGIIKSIEEFLAFGGVLDVEEYEKLSPEQKEIYKQYHTPSGKYFGKGMSSKNPSRLKKNGDKQEFVWKTTLES